MMQLLLTVSCIFQVWSIYLVLQLSYGKTADSEQTICQPLLSL